MQINHISAGHVYVIVQN